MTEQAGVAGAAVVAAAGDTSASSSSSFFCPHVLFPGENENDISDEELCWRGFMAFLRLDHIDQFSANWIDDVKNMSVE